jgi:hypothetical protein
MLSFANSTSAASDWLDRRLLSQISSVITVPGCDDWFRYGSVWESAPARATLHGLPTGAVTLSPFRGRAQHPVTVSNDHAADVAADVHMDAFEFLANTPTGSADCIFLDAPADIHPDETRRLFAHCRRALKSTGCVLSVSHALGFQIGFSRSTSAPVQVNSNRAVVVTRSVVC